MWEIQPMYVGKPTSKHSKFITSSTGPLHIIMTDQVKHVNVQFEVYRHLMLISTQWLKLVLINY